MKVRKRAAEKDQQEKKLSAGKELPEVVGTEEATDTVASSHEVISLVSARAVSDHRFYDKHDAQQEVSISINDRFQDRNSKPVAVGHLSEENLLIPRKSTCVSKSREGRDGWALLDACVTSV